MYNRPILGALIDTTRLACQLSFRLQNEGKIDGAVEAERVISNASAQMAEHFGHVFARPIFPKASSGDLREQIAHLLDRTDIQPEVRKELERMISSRC